MAPYPSIFTGALLLNAIVTFRSSGLWDKFIGGQRAATQAATAAINSDEKKRHSRLLSKYLCVYLAATLSDWLQGPYVYALYDAYGFSQHDIAVLFVAGFGSSMIFGSFVGGMADQFGRRRFVIIFSIVYAASCITKHFKDYNILMLGRLLGGVATSLLFSVFEAWLIRSHSDAKIDKSFLSASFSWAAYGNSIVAIVAGLLANKASSAGSDALRPLISGNDTIMIGGFLNPFDIALVALVVCGFLAASLWEENYGDSSATYGAKGGDDTDSKSGGSPATRLLVDDGGSAKRDDDDTGSSETDAKWYEGLKNAYSVTIRSKDVLQCGIISSLFEGSMYVFVFMWTPALQNLSTEKSSDLPFGLIFSTFMVCCMAGSSIFSILISRVSGEVLAVAVFTMASLAMAAVALDSVDTVSFCSMLVFEICVGMYFPIMGTMKGVIVPEDKRAAIYNLYRIPLNFIVLLSLLTDLTPQQSFMLCSIMLGVAAVMQFQLAKRRMSTSGMGMTGQQKGVEDEEAIALTATPVKSSVSGSSDATGEEKA